MRIPITGRERSAYFILRKKGYTISALSQAFGRSTSVVHKALKTAFWIAYTRRLNDLRKIPRLIRERHATYSLRTLRKYLKAWEIWILSEEGEPP